MLLGCRSGLTAISRSPVQVARPLARTQVKLSLIGDAGLVVRGLCPVAAPAASGVGGPVAGGEARARVARVLVARGLAAGCPQRGAGAVSVT